jgi:hypothetical protein
VVSFRGIVCKKEKRVTASFSKRAYASAINQTTPRSHSNSNEKSIQEKLIPRSVSVATGLALCHEQYSELHSQIPS